MTKAQDIKIEIACGYYGRIKVSAFVDGIEHIIENVDLEGYLEKQISEKGYIVSKTNRMKYPRLIINN